MELHQQVKNKKVKVEIKESESVFQTLKDPETGKNLEEFLEDLRRFIDNNLTKLNYFLNIPIKTERMSTGTEFQARKKQLKTELERKKFVNNFILFSLFYFIYFIFSLFIFSFYFIFFVYYF